MTARALQIAERAGRCEGLREVWFWLVACFGLTVFFVAYHPDPGAAVATAHGVARWEAAAGWGGLELGAQRSAHALGLAAVAETVYWLSQLVVCWVVLVVLYVVARPAYRKLRTLIIASELLAYFVFWAVPVASPAASGLSIGSLAVSNAAPQTYDRYAALPSLHVATAVAVAWVLSGPGMGRARWLAWLWPIAVAWSVLATGNHFVVDVWAGAGLVPIAAATARVVLPAGHGG